MKLQNQQAHFYGWTNAVLLFSIYLITVGLVFYGFAAIFPAMIKATGWGRGEAAMAHTIHMIFSAFLTPVVAVTLNRFGGRKTLALGLMILLAGLSLLGTVANELWQWIFIWGFIVSFGLAFASLLSVQTIIMFWFDTRRTVVLGLAMSGAAVGGFVAQPFFTWLIQQTNSWRTGWLTGVIFVILGLILCFFVRSKPEDVGQYPYGLNPDEAETIAADGSIKVHTYRTSVPWSLAEALKTRALYLIGAFMIAHIMSVSMVVSHGVLHLTDLEYTRMQAASVLSAMLLGSGVARVPMGWLGDLIEPRWIATAAMTLMLTAFIGIWQAPNHVSVIIFGFVFGFSYGTALVMMPALFGNFFGPASFASINGFIVPFMIVCGASVPVGAGYIADNFGSYDPAFIILSVITAGGVICTAFLSPPKKTSALESTVKSSS
ncbi:MAG: MFS transporter [Deltaproteobacteria bacterium]|nr:MFS transporter [Deltaproteobacteria bacterium]MBW2053572.1 MFS transporter [Deltaproteobacteria bacterium]MBW2142393.1 MFS transporter [Deltaproteobacteria bacterium]MBW2324204.1 MFS transporter [Deltaproteobacteria bacterium]